MAKKAYVLISGGLDSALAVKMLQDQGVEVVGVYISTGFCVSAQQKRNGRFDENKPDVFKVSEELGIELEVIDISQDYISIVANPKHGWGKNVNPCIDCRIHMLQKTKVLMDEKGGDFIATGEVLGQRPKSQRRDTQDIIESESGLKGLLVRPLSAQFYKPTIPETEGWIDRDKLGKIEGRSRKKQMAMAKQYGLTMFTAPAGGCCYLTDENYAVRFKELLLDIKGDDEKIGALTHEEMILLSIGRHIKVRTGLKIACGREEQENALIDHYKSGKIILKTTEKHPGPTAILNIYENKDETAIAEELKHWQPDNINIDPTLAEACKNKSLPISAFEIAICGSIVARYANSKTDQNVNIVLEKYNLDNQLEYSFEFISNPLSDPSIIDSRLMIKQNEKSILSNIA